MAGGLKIEGKPLEVCSGGCAGCCCGAAPVAAGGRGAAAGHSFWAAAPGTGIGTLCAKRGARRRQNSQREARQQGRNPCRPARFATPHVVLRLTLIRRS